MNDLVAAFETSAGEAAAEVFFVADVPGKVRGAIEELTHDEKWIVLGVGEFLSSRVVKELREIPRVLQDPTDEQLSTAQVGVSDAFAGVASTGSVCIAMGPPFVATASLLMPLHIVILAAERIVARPRDLFNPECLGGAGVHRNLVFITGPSATADMGPLVRGVHGPHRLQIVVVR